MLSIEPVSSGRGKGDILHFLVSAGGIDRQKVGRIELQGRVALVEVPDDWGPRLARALDGQALGQRRVSVRVVSRAMAGAVGASVARRRPAKVLGSDFSFGFADGMIMCSEWAARVMAT